jgi:hypothetical protein
MAIFQTQTLSFRQEMLQGVHDLLTDTLNMALYTGASNLNETTTVYTTTDEVSGGGYTAGGQIIAGAAISASNGVVYVTFDNVVWTPATFTAAGALIYNASKGNRSIAVLSFGADKTASGTFTVQMPPNTSNSALLRFT